MGVIGSSRMVPASTGTGSGTITDITSTGGTVTITNPTGPTTNLEVTPGGSGTVTSVSVVSANGLAGTVATATTTPAITLSTTITGILKGNGTAVSAATAGTDYLTPSGNGSNLTGLTVSQVSGAAPLASPTFTGTPAAPTATAGTSTTQIATTAFVATSFAPLASPALTGTPTAPTAAAGTSTTQLATTAFVQSALAAVGGSQTLTPSVSGSGTLSETTIAGIKFCVLTLNAWDDAGQTLTFTTAFTADVPGWMATPGIPSSFVPTAAKTTFQLPTTSAAAITGVFILMGV